jgi:lipopolysaccharide transport system permease protein
VSSIGVARPSPSQPSLNPLRLGGDLFRNRSLIGQLVEREVGARYRGSFLGLFWSFLNPILLLAIFTFVFGVVFNARWPQHTTGRLSEFAVVLFCGMLVLSLFSECLVRAPGMIVASANYVKRVVFPLEILPVVSLGAALFHALVSLTVLVAAHLAIGGRLHWTLALLPVVAVPLLFLVLGLTWFVASLGVFFRDLHHVVALLVQVLTFLTPVFYPIEALPPGVRPLMRLNPLTVIVESLRRVVLWGLAPEWGGLALWTLVNGVVMLLGYAWFMKTKRAFADVL